MLQEKAIHLNIVQWKQSWVTSYCWLTDAKMYSKSTKLSFSKIINLPIKKIHSYFQSFVEYRQSRNEDNPWLITKFACSRTSLCDHILHVTRKPTAMFTLSSSVSLLFSRFLCSMKYVCNLCWTLPDHKQAYSL